jgi:hypothetical protein
MNFQPSQLEQKQVERTGKCLARELRAAMEDFGGLRPELAAAVAMSMLAHAVPQIVTMEHSGQWPGSLTDNREQMQRGLMELLQAALADDDRQ